MSETATHATLTKTVHVEAPVGRAFELFTARLGEWWPLPTHSVGGETARDVAMQCRVGGQIVETLADGSTAVWGTVTDWVSPQLVAFTWHPGQPEAEATRVEVSFAASGEGTEVTLRHSGWSSRPDGERARSQYDGGWDLVLSRFTVSVAR
jgi:uncharacterized protein YndB with AHSA1/START domain